MSALKNRLVPVLFALAGVLFLVPTIKQVIEGEPIKTVFVVLAMACLVLALVFFVVGRKSGGGSGPPSA